MKNIIEIKQFEELNLKQTFRAYIIYEKIMGESFSSKAGLNGIIVLFYSYIMGSNKDMIVDYDDYMDWLDEHPSMLNEFSDWLVKINTAANSAPVAEEQPDGKQPNEQQPNEPQPNEPQSGEEAGHKKPKKV